MNIKLTRYFSVTLLLIAFSAMVLYAKGDGDKKSSPNSTLGSPSWTTIDINNIQSWFQNTGSSDINQQNNGGLIFPKGSGRNAAFQSGFVWGGKVDGTVEVGGSTYYQGTQPGRIKPDGTAAASGDADNRIYRVRRNYKDPNADFSAEMLDQNMTAAAVYAQYDLDWKQWPAAYGAPYEDVNGDGKYDANVDIPGVPGADQTIWFVANDLDPTTVSGMYGSLPMGIEEQVTIFAYNATGPLANMFFRKYLIINKNPAKKPFTEMYVSMWTDVDLGDAGDDYVGCDTTLSMMYFYKSKAVDAVYSPLPPPATGFDFFQGPKIPGAATDRAIFKGKYVNGYKNRGMDGFYYFINSDAILTDPVRSNYTTGTLEFWNLFTGKISTTGQPYTDPNTGVPTKYPLSGDPLTRKGWIDGQLNPPGDRRGGMVSGPFTMAYGDTQEVVVSEMCAGAFAGVDRLGAISLLKFYDLSAQLAYNNFFQVATPPPAPVVTATAADKSIILSWGSNVTAVTATENYNKAGYIFQGYNVYQLPTASSTSADAVRLATYDVIDGVGKIQDLQFDISSGVVLNKVVEFGSDNGISRAFTVNVDYFKGNTILNNGTRYYLAVTAYAYNPDPNAVPKVLETPMQIITVVPHSPDPGVRYSAAAGATVTASHTSTGAVSDGTVVATVIDPTKVTGASYSVKFKTDASKNVVWYLQRGSTTILDNQTNQTADNNYLFTDGLQVVVQGAPIDFKDFLVTANANGPLTPNSTFTVNWDWANASANQQKSGAVWVVSANGASSYDYSYWLTRVPALIASADPAVTTKGVQNLIPDDIEIRFTAAGSDAFLHWTTKGIMHVPFEIWNTRGTASTADDYQIMPMVYDLDNSGTFSLTRIDSPQSGGGNDPQTDAIYMAMPLNTTPGNKGYLDLLAKVKADPAGAAAANLWNGYNATFGSRSGMGRLVFVGWNLTDTTKATFDALPAAKRLPETGTIFKFVTTKPNSVNDVFTFTAPSVTTDANLAKTDIQQINVFPNPYYGVNPLEINKYQRFVTFNHLPQTATIRIFNLAGQLIRTLQKNTTDQFFRWDLNNEASLPVASGLYIVYVDMPDLGTTKILKVAIIQEQQVLDRF